MQKILQLRPVAACAYKGIYIWTIGSAPTCYLCPISRRVVTVRHNALNSIRRVKVAIRRLNIISVRANLGRTCTVRRVLPRGLCSRVWLCANPSAYRLCRDRLWYRRMCFDLCFTASAVCLSPSALAWVGTTTRKVGVVRVESAVTVIFNRGIYRLRAPIR